jgi:PST family polysaccharide transporter
MPVTLAGRTLSGGIWQFVSVVSQAVMQLLVLAVLARFVLPEEFGLIAISGIAISFIHVFSQMGLGPALVQRREISAFHIRVAFTSTILLGALVFGLILVVAEPVAVFFRQPEVTDLLRVISLSVPITSFGLAAEALLERKLEFKKLFLARFGSYALGYAPVGVAMAVLGYGAWALVSAMLAQSLLRSTALFLLNPHPLRPSFSAGELRELFTFGSGHTLAKFFNFGALKGDYFVVGRTLGADALGLYERIFRVMQLPGEYLGHVIFKVLFPAMARIQNQPARLAKVYFAGIGLVNIVLMPSSVFFCILAPELVLILLGPSWVEATLPLQILFTAIFLRSSVGLSDSLSRAVGAVYKSAARRAIYACAVVLGSWIGHFWGLVGVAFGVNVAILIHYTIMAQLSLSCIEGSWLVFFREHLPGLRLGAITLVITLPLVSLLRLVSDSPFLIFGAAALVVGSVLSATIMTLPQLLGSSSRWIIERILKESPFKTSRFSRFLMIRLSQR